MTTRWGIQAANWPDVKEWPNEAGARRMVKVLTCSQVSQPWTKLWRDDGDGWVLVETVPAEREHRRNATTP